MSGQEERSNTSDKPRNQHVHREHDTRKWEEVQEIVEVVVVLEEGVVVGSFSGSGRSSKSNSTTSNRNIGGGRRQSRTPGIVGGFGIMPEPRPPRRRPRPVPPPPPPEPRPPRHRR